VKIETRNWVFATILVFLGLAAAVLITPLVQWGIPAVAQADPSIVLSLLVIAGVIGQLLSLTIVALAFAATNLSDRNQALGLPQGTVRAVIALSLILIFMITAMYLYGHLARKGFGEVYKSTGISEEMLKAWPQDEIVSVTPREEQGVKVFDVERAVGQSEASERFAAQILTTVSTLVAAIAAFYFGTRAVAVARGIEAPSEPVITGIEPNTGDAGKVIRNVEISGKNFDGPVVVRLEKGAETIPTMTDPPTSATKIICAFDLTGKSTGDRDLVVVNQDGAEAREEKAFKVTTAPAPTVKSIAPALGEIAKGTVDVTITGTGFFTDPKARIELRIAQQVIEPPEVEVSSDKEISCTFDLKGKTAGKGKLAVINNDKQEVEADFELQ
jgi:hypothetical protein